MEPVAQVLPGFGIRANAARHRDLAARDGGVEKVEELATKERSEDVDGEEIAAARGDPALAVRRQATPCDDRVQVRVEGEVPRPGVEHQGNAELGAESLRVVTELEERCRSCGEEQAEDLPAVVAARGRSSAGKVKTTWK